MQYSNENKAPGPAMRRSPAESARLESYYSVNGRCQQLLADRGFTDIWRIPGRVVALVEAPEVAEYHAAIDIFSEDPYRARIALEQLCVRLS